MSPKFSNEHRECIMITGHRGAASLAPENTLVSIEQAAKAGAIWVEIDTQLSANGIPMVFHDRTVDRCTNGTGNIADLDLTALKALDAGSWFGSEFIGTSIPTLSEALDKCLELEDCRTIVSRPGWLCGIRFRVKLGTPTCFFICFRNFGNIILRNR